MLLPLPPLLLLGVVFGLLNPRPSSSIATVSIAPVTIIETLMFFASAYFSKASNSSSKENNKYKEGTNIEVITKVEKMQKQILILYYD